MHGIFYLHDPFIYIYIYIYILIYVFNIIYIHIILDNIAAMSNLSENEGDESEISFEYIPKYALVIYVWLFF